MKKLAILVALAALTLSGSGCLLRVHGGYDDDGVSHHHREDRGTRGRTPQAPPRPRD
jgi:hypothetical protein